MSEKPPILTSPVGKTVSCNFHLTQEHYNILVRMKKRFRLTHSQLVRLAIEEMPKNKSLIGRLCAVREPYTTKDELNPEPLELERTNNE